MKRYWARINKAGSVTIHEQAHIGPFFFSNAREEEDRIAVVVMTEVPMTSAEAALANACPSCGQPRPVSAGEATK